MSFDKCSVLMSFYKRLRNVGTHPSCGCPAFSDIAFAEMLKPIGVFFLTFLITNNITSKYINSLHFPRLVKIGRTFVFDHLDILMVFEPLLQDLQWMRGARYFDVPFGLVEAQGKLELT